MKNLLITKHCLEITLNCKRIHEILDNGNNGTNLIYKHISNNGSSDRNARILLLNHTIFIPMIFVNQFFWYFDIVMSLVRINLKYQ